MSVAVISGLALYCCQLILESCFGIETICALRHAMELCPSNPQHLLFVPANILVALSLNIVFLRLNTYRVMLMLKTRQIHKMKMWRSWQLRTRVKGRIKMGKQIMQKAINELSLSQFLCF